MRRWITLAVLAWLSLMLAGREHALAAFGLELACLHPGDAPRAHHAEPHDAATEEQHGPAAGAARDDDRSHHDETASDGAGDEDCPPGCTDCACGAAPCAPSMPIGVADRGWTTGTYAAAPTRDGPTPDRVALDRPPRRG